MLENPTFVKKSDFEMAGNSAFLARAKHDIGDAKHIFRDSKASSQRVPRGFSEAAQSPTRARVWPVFCQKNVILWKEEGRRSRGVRRDAKSPTAAFTVPANKV